MKDKLIALVKRVDSLRWFKIAVWVCCSVAFWHYLGAVALIAILIVGVVGYIEGRFAERAHENETVKMALETLEEQDKLLKEQGATIETLRGQNLMQAMMLRANGQQQAPQDDKPTIH